MTQEEQWLEMNPGCQKIVRCIYTDPELTRPQSKQLSFSLAESQAVKTKEGTRTEQQSVIKKEKKTPHYKPIQPTDPPPACLGPPADMNAHRMKSSNEPVLPRVPTQLH